MKVALVFLCAVTFAAAAPANSYDYQPSTYTAPHSAYPAQHAYQHKPTYKHDNYDYVRFIPSLISLVYSNIHG